MSRPRFFHVDLDAFYASVEQRDNPELKGKPVIIGAAPGSRGVVSACSYEARTFGVHSAMPIAQAVRLCPGGIFLLPRMKRYYEVSQKVMTLLDSFSPQVHQVSVDEAFLDMSGTERLFGGDEAAGRLLKNRVLEETGLVISVGVAANPYLAKLASDFDKPDGLCLVAPGQETAFLDRLELADLWGVGKKTLNRLRDFNIYTIPELRARELVDLESQFGHAGGAYLYRIVRGIDPGIINLEVRSRSLSHETTFEKDVVLREVLENTILELAHQVMFRMMKEKLKSGTVTLKLRLSDFTTTDAQQSLGHYVVSAEELFQYGRALLEKRWDGKSPVRLLGLGFSKVVDEDSGGQGELFEDPFERKKQAEKAVLKIRQKGNPITKAVFLPPGKKDKPPPGN
ncbi:MAG: DNA polymerase IV [Spirochaetales bacterium]|jgi:DNA polymerase-4|nr:DNA polymerase IV [Spirochaetales bacterium]